MTAAWLRHLFRAYAASLPEHVRALLERFQFVDCARKVVGVGSVGTRCYVVLLQDTGAGDPLFLQLKEARRSVLEPHAGRGAYRSHGKRVVVGQRLLQASSDAFLGWTSDGITDYYVRQLRDMKGSVDLDRGLRPAGLAEYAALCGRLLAQGHARTGDAALLSGYLGRGDRFDQAVLGFARAYADQTERDHAALERAAKAGRIRVERGV